MYARYGSQPPAFEVPSSPMPPSNVTYKQEKTAFEGVWKKGPSYLVKVLYRGDKYLVGEYQSEKEACLAHDDVVFDMYGDSMCHFR